MTQTYMLDTNICSFIMRERPAAVLSQLQRATENQHDIVISVITHYEMMLGVIGKNASPKLAGRVQSFNSRLSAILPWDQAAAQAAASIERELCAAGQRIGGNDTMIAGHAIAAGCILVTNNTREFRRVPRLLLEDWAKE